MNKDKITEACKILNPALCSEGRKGLKLLLEGFGVDFDTQSYPGLLDPNNIALDGAIEIYEDDDKDVLLFFRHNSQLYLTVGDYRDLLTFYSTAKGDPETLLNSSFQSEHAVEVVAYEDALGETLEWDYFDTRYVQHLEYICNIEY